MSKKWKPPTKDFPCKDCDSWKLGLLYCLGCERGEWKEATDEQATE